MSTKHEQEVKKESTGLAFSGMILALIGLGCMFIPGWKSFAVISSSVGLVVSLFSFYKTKEVGAKRGRAVAGIFLSVLALFVALMFVVLKRIDPPVDSVAMPRELKDSSAAEADRNEALEKLNNITDSSGSH